MSDETTPKWDCDIACGYDDCFLKNDNLDDIEPSQENEYIGKIIRLLKNIEMKPNAKYYSECGIYNDWFETWGYVDRFMFELIPDTKYLEGGENEAHLGKLIAVIEKD